MHGCWLWCYYSLLVATAMLLTVLSVNVGLGNLRQYRNPCVDRICSVVVSFENCDILHPWALISWWSTPQNVCPVGSKLCLVVLSQFSGIDLCFFFSSAYFFLSKAMKRPLFSFTSVVIVTMVLFYNFSCLVSYYYYNCSILYSWVPALLGLYIPGLCSQRHTACAFGILGSGYIFYSICSIIKK